MAAAKKINIVGPAVKKWDIVRETILKIEHGQRRVVDAEVLLLARALGCTMEDLLGSDAAGAAEYARHSLEKD